VISAQHVGVVILTHGQRDEYRQLVASLLEDGLPAAAITVVHNPAGSRPLERRPGDPAVSMVECAVNRGYASGMNAGIRRCLEAGVGQVLLLTGEVRFRPGALAVLLDAGRQATGFGILGPALWWLGENRPWSYGGTRSAAGATDQIRERIPTPDDDGIAACDWVDGSAVLVRAQVFADVGLLDERFFLYFEETEFCLRAVRAGWRVGVVLGAVAEQAPGDARRPGGYSYLLTRNGLEYSRLVAGSRGIAAGLGRSLRETLRMLRVVAGIHSPAPARKWALTKVIATWLGVAAFVARRWGPPPGIVPGLGDIKAAG
jgi:GT2 family glycosyltransferase